MKEQIKDFVQSKTMKLAVIGTCAAAPLMTFASATEGDSTDAVLTAVQTGLTSATDTVKTSLIAIAGIGIGIFAIRWGVRVAMSFFKSVSRG